MFFTICWIAIFIGIVMFLIGLLDDFDDVMAPIGFCIMLMTGFIGFGMIGNCYPMSDGKIEHFIPTEIAKSQSTTFVEWSGTTYTFKDKKVYDTDNKNFRVKRTHFLNAYDSDCGFKDELITVDPEVVQKPILEKE